MESGVKLILECDAAIPATRDPNVFNIFASR